MVKYLSASLILAAIVGLEVWHELAHAEGPQALQCVAPESQREVLRESLLLHLKSH
jgi:hypothetical protein